MTLQEIANQIAAFKKTLKPDEIATSADDFNPKKTKLIDGAADFSDSQIENLGNLTTIGENAYFIDSKVKNLGNLTTIGGTAFFQNSKVENLGNLSTIGVNAFFKNSKIKNLGNLSYIGENIYANGKKLTEEQIEQHIKNINEINIIRKGLYYISNGEVFIKPSVLVDNKHFSIRDLRFNDNGTIAMK